MLFADEASDSVRLRGQFFCEGLKVASYAVLEGTHARDDLGEGVISQGCAGLVWVGIGRNCVGFAVARSSRLEKPGRRCALARRWGWLAGVVPPVGVVLIANG